MKILCVIPARYKSSRLPGKPLADICGKPMIWWVYQRVLPIKCIDIVVATDDERISGVCKKYNIPFIMTGEHSTHVSRIFEVSQKIDADWYISVCGDEPIIETENIVAIIPDYVNNTVPEVKTLGRVITVPTELIDTGNIKAIVNNDSDIIYLSRAVLPFPYKTILFDYKKTIGVECFNKKALDYFVNTEKGNLEKIEDITLLRFIENRQKVKLQIVKSESLSVDTEKDLEKIRKKIINELDEE